MSLHFEPSLFPSQPLQFRPSTQSSLAMHSPSNQCSALIGKAHLKGTQIRSRSAGTRATKPCRTSVLAGIAPTSPTVSVSTTCGSAIATISRLLHKSQSFTVNWVPIRAMHLECQMLLIAGGIDHNGLAGSDLPCDAFPKPAPDPSCDVANENSRGYLQEPSGQIPAQTHRACRQNDDHHQLISSSSSA